MVSGTLPAQLLWPAGDRRRWSGLNGMTLSRRPAPSGFVPGSAPAASMGRAMAGSLSEMAVRAADAASDGSKPVGADLAKGVTETAMALPTIRPARSLKDGRLPQALIDFQKSRYKKWLIPSRHPDALVRMVQMVRRCTVRDGSRWSGRGQGQGREIRLARMSFGLSMSPGFSARQLTDSVKDRSISLPVCKARELPL